MTAIADDADAELLAARPGPVDLVTVFARPLPFSVIADVLGVPAQHQPWLGAAMEVFGQSVAGQRDHANVERGNTATAEMLDWFDGALRDRADQPRQDVLSLVAAAPSEGEQRADLLANCLFFVLAGHATTTTLLTAGVHLLDEHRAQLDELLARPDGWSAAVEELLRYISPTTLTGVTACVDVEVDGCPVPAGGRRALAFAAANRDPVVFPRADELDLARSPNPHLAFSAGRTSAWARRRPACTPRSPSRLCSVGCRGCGSPPHRRGWAAHRSVKSRPCPSSGPPIRSRPDTRGRRAVAGSPPSGPDDPSPARLPGRGSDPGQRRRRLLGSEQNGFRASRRTPFSNGP